jgi:hypothetical protein
VARRNYYNEGDWYSEWHRAIEKKIAYIDIDSVGICWRCKMPIYLAETSFDKGQTWKATTTTEALANMAGLPSFLVFYKVVHRKVESFRIRQLTPEKGNERFITPDSWVEILQALQRKHDPDCIKKDAA